MTSIDFVSARAAIMEERARLVHQLHELGANEDGDLRSDRDFGDGSFADAGAATAERTEVIGLVDSLKSQVDEIDMALERMDLGLYGTCSSCGNEISAARLEARPSSVLCVDCKSRLG